MKNSTQADLVALIKLNCLENSNVTQDVIIIDAICRKHSTIHEQPRQLTL